MHVILLGTLLGDPSWHPSWWTLLGVVILLQKTHTRRVVSSHWYCNIAIVHAAPVGCLPPPGTSPAARKCGQHIRSSVSPPPCPVSPIQRRRAADVDADSYSAHRHPPPRDDDLGRRCDHQSRAGGVDP